MVDKVEVPVESNPQSQEYIDAMASKGEAAVNGGVAPEVVAEIEPKPEGIPDKFYNAETGIVDYNALAKSYVELEKSKSKPSDKPVAPPAAKPEETPSGDEAANKAVAEAGLDMANLQKEYSESGTLTPESFAKLEKAGIPEAMVHDYIEGQLAKVEVMRTQAHSITDGAEGYKAMIDYGKANLSAEEISAYNTAVNSKNPQTRELAVQGMWAKYNADTGNAGGNLLSAKGNGKVDVGSYQSSAEMRADMSDPRYKTDEAFRAKVAAKLGKSDIF